MDRETLVNIVYSGKVRFIPVRRCSLCDEYIGYKFVKMYNGSIIPVFSSGCGCCGVNNGQLFEKTWDEEYEYWADNEDAIREELHHNQYEDRLYYENGDVYVEPLNEIA